MQDSCAKRSVKGLSMERERNPMQGVVPVKDGRYPEGYNGWPNKETWRVHMWLTNEPVMYMEAKEAAQKGERALRELVEELCLGSEPEAGLETDLILDALDQVDWTELRRALIED